MREKENEGGGCRENALLCLTLVTMGHFLGQARLGPPLD